MRLFTLVKVMQADGRNGKWNATRKRETEKIGLTIEDL